MRISELLRTASARLTPAEAELLLLAALAEEGHPFSRFDLHTRAGEEVPPSVQQKVAEWTTARAQGRPLQHLTRRQVFLEHEYEAGPEALIPRPETEVLVALALEKLARLHPAGPQRGWEVGLGSGILSIELLHRFPHLHMVASELSAAARDLARRNAQKILTHADRLEILPVQDPLETLENFSAQSPTPDFIISNPPYLLEGTLEATGEVARYEPAEALYAPPQDVLHFYRAIAQRGLAFRKGAFRVFLELPHERAEEIAQLFQKQGWETELHCDLNGRPRVLVAH